MNCKNCGAVVSTEVRDGVFLCDYCYTENQVPKTPEVKLPEKEEQTEKPIKKSVIDFAKIARSIVRIQSKNGSATGFFIHEDGLVLTNAHVVEDQPFVQGFIGDSPVVNELEVKANGHIIGVDLALLELLDDSVFEVISLAEEVPSLGETVFAIGNPKNLGMSVSKGAISRKKPGEFQLDMTLNAGNSGGPVINEASEVIGIVSYLLEEVNGLSFAIDIDSIQDFLKKSQSSELLDPPSTSHSENDNTLDSHELDIETEFSHTEGSSPFNDEGFFKKSIDEEQDIDSNSVDEKAFENSSIEESFQEFASDQEESDENTPDESEFEVEDLIDEDDFEKEILEDDDFEEEILEENELEVSEPEDLEYELQMSDSEESMHDEDIDSKEEIKGKEEGYNV